MDKIQDKLKKTIAEAAGVDVDQIKLEHPEIEEHGDYSTNIALVLKGGKQLAEKIAQSISQDTLIAKTEVAGPGFINIWLQKDFFVDQIDRVLNDGHNYGKTLAVNHKRVMVEYAHPNTHKEMHIGHMRTLITGEAVVRLLEFVGHTVFRANYQGDIGPHVAKSIWGTTKILVERDMTWNQAEDLDLKAKAHLLGEGYVRGNKDYEENKTEIDELNKQLYAQDSLVKEIYERTRRWSLDYYDTFYTRFGTKFDRLFLESEMAVRGKKLVEDHVGTVFTKSQGAIVYEGDKNGFHTRVFVTSDGNPTYEGKELANAMTEREAFEFDQKIHVVANEQMGYFQVVFKALESIDPWYIGKQTHLSMGMVNLIGRKISSRTGEIVTVDDLLDTVKEELKPLMKEGGGEALEQVTIGAVKYSVLKNHPTVNTAFDINQSINLHGNSGPYIQYTHARIMSVVKNASATKLDSDYRMNNEEERVVKMLYKFGEVVEESASRLAPNLLCNYLYELAQRFNAFYNAHTILGSEGQSDTGTKNFRINLAMATGIILKNGLNLLGIEAPERM